LFIVIYRYYIQVAVAPIPEPIISDGHVTQLGAIGVPIFFVFDGH
jgi:hypothetical protein